MERRQKNTHHRYTVHLEGTTVICLLLSGGSKKKKKNCHPRECLLAEDPALAQRDHQNWYQTISFLTQTSSRPPRRNLFTARRWSVGSAHLPHWNNCCDDRLCTGMWRQALFRIFWGFGNRAKNWCCPRRRHNPSAIVFSLIIRSGFTFAFLNVKGIQWDFFLLFFYRGLPPALMCWELCRNAALQERLAVASILAQCPDIVIHNISDGYISIWRLYHWLMWHIRKGGKNTSLFALLNTHCKSFLGKIIKRTESDAFSESSSSSSRADWNIEQKQGSYHDHLFATIWLNRQGSLDTTENDALKNKGQRLRCQISC